MCRALLNADPEVTSGLSVVTDIAWCCGLVADARRYTKFYGVDMDAAAEQLAHDALLGELPE